MGNNCFRCGRPVFAMLEVSAMVGQDRLEITEEAKPAAVCASCLILFLGRVGEFFKTAQKAERAPGHGDASVSP